jgi:hypothetical protein
MTPIVCPAFLGLNVLTTIDQPLDPASHRRGPPVLAPPRNMKRISNPERIGAPRLVDLCIATARRNVQFIDDVGNLLPLKIVLPIVKAVERPDQLALLEKNRPGLADETHEMWFNFIKRDVPGWEKMLLTRVKRSGETWTVDEIRKKATQKTYRTCMAKEQEEVAQATEVLRQATAKETQESRDRETRIVDKVPSSWEKHHHRTPSQRGGSGVISKLRREAAAHRQAAPGGSLSTPSHLLRFKRQVHGTIRPPRMRRLLDPAGTPTRAAVDKERSPMKAEARSKPKEASGKELEGDAAKETKAPASKPAESRGATPKRKRPVTVLLPSKRKK